MKKIERVRAALRSEVVDRPPYSFWTHLPGIDLDPQRLARTTADFCTQYGMDFVKSMPNGLYCVEDWGCICDYSDIERGGVAKVVRPAVSSAQDWDKLAQVDVTRGSFGRELGHLALLTELVGPDMPVLTTVFSPLTIAAKLSNNVSRVHANCDATALMRGLDVITEVTCAFVREALSRGCVGIFFAIQEATRSAFNEATYRRFGEPYDRRVLDAANAAGGWFNAVHMHGEDILFEVLKDYEASALNWHIGETPPSIADYRSAGGKRSVLGGLQRGHITCRDRESISRDIEIAVNDSKGRGLLLAPACVIRHPVDSDTLTWTAEHIQALASG